MKRCRNRPRALAREFLGATLTYWQEWVRTLAVPADWQEAVIRSAITLKLCTYEDTGAVLAALTTSIPGSRRTARATGTIATAGCATATSWCRRSIASGATRTMEAYLHYIDHIIASSTADTLAAAVRHHRRSARRGKIADDLSGLSRHGPGALRQSRRRTGTARRLRFGDPRGDAAVLR